MLGYSRKYVVLFRAVTQAGKNTTRFCLRLSLSPQDDPFEIIFNYRQNTYCHRQRSFQGNKDVDWAVVSAVCIIYRVCVETAEDRLIRQTSKSTSFSKY